MREPKEFPVLDREAMQGGRPGAYWFWATLPDPATMRRQLTDFRAQGFGRIYIQARPAMALEVYLSEAFLAAYRQAVEIMAELGLKAGLYDDYAWTSGQAGGRTVAGADHLRERHLFWASGRGARATIAEITATLGASLGPAIRNWLHEGGTPVFAEWQIEAAVLWQDGACQDITPEVRLVETGPLGAVAEVRDLPAEAEWTVFVSARASNSRIINYLLPEAGARFVSQGLEPFARALSGLMPQVLDSLFFDQPAPCLYRWQGGGGNLMNSLLWSEALRAGIAARGCVALQLAALLRETDADTAATRSFVYRLYTGLIERAFFAPLRDFCDRHGLALTGHEILPHVASFALNGGFTSIDPRVALAVDFFGLDRWRDVTAVDANNLDAQLAPLLGAGIARAAGRKTCLAELYITSLRSETRAAGQWEMTPAELRAQMIRLHMLGAGQVILHALYADDGDGRTAPLETLRFDFAPGFNFQPWWPVMRQISDEIAALAGFIDGAAPGREVAILYPLETALTEGPRHRHATEFGAWCEAILAHGHRPLIVDEAGLSRLEPGRIAALVLPGVTRLEGAAVTQALPGVPRWQRLEEMDLSGLAAPTVAPQPGLRALVLGRDAAGLWRLVLFNEGEVALQTSLGLRLAPQELRCLTLPPGAERVEEPEVSPAEVLLLDTGWTLQTRGEARPIRVDQGWQAQGDAEFSGIGLYETRFTLKRAAEVVLELPGLASAAWVSLEGRACGEIWHAPFRLALGPLAAGPHHLRLEVANTAANRYYAGTDYAGAGWPDLSGLTAPPRLLLTF